MVKSNAVPLLSHHRSRPEVASARFRHALSRCSALAASCASSASLVCAPLADALLSVVVFMRIPNESPGQWTVAAEAERLSWAGREMRSHLHSLAFESTRWG